MAVDRDPQSRGDGAINDHNHGAAVLIDAATLEF